MSRKVRQRHKSGNEANVEISGEAGDEIEVETRNPHEVTEDGLTGDAAIQTEEEDFDSSLAAETARIRALTGEAEEEAESEEEDPYDVLQRQFSNLEAQNKALEAQRNAEAQRRTELENKAHESQLSEIQNHRVIVEHAIAAKNTEVDDAKRAYRDAREQGDIDAEIAATEALADARAELAQLHAGHSEIVRRIESTPKQMAQAAPADPAEHFIVQNFSNPRDQAWLRQHKQDIFGNEKRQQLALAGHQIATLKHELQPGTDAYYDFMDDHMGYTEQHAAETGKLAPSSASAPAAPAPRKRAAASAPPSRSSSAPGRGGAERVTPEIASLAADLGISASEYMENQRLIRSGKWHHSF